jgi:hypothetical protein
MTDRSLDVRMSEDGALLAFKITDDPHAPWVIVTVDEDGMYTTYTRITAPSGSRPVRPFGNPTPGAEAYGLRVTRLDADGEPKEEWTP